MIYGEVGAWLDGWSCLESLERVRLSLGSLLLDETSSN